MSSNLAILDVLLVVGAESEQSWGRTGVRDYPLRRNPIVHLQQL